VITTAFSFSVCNFVELLPTRFRGFFKSAQFLAFILGDYVNVKVKYVLTSNPSILLANRNSFSTDIPLCGHCDLFDNLKQLSNFLT
jgi:hypothetical protein